MHMESDCQVPDPSGQPAFFYHLGDVVYYYGEDNGYYSQFYEPYQQYPLPIFAIPGNHDGDVFDDTEQSLAAFAANFCAPVPAITKDAGDVSRDAMTQPNVYWTLDTPFVTIIGLYTNVPEGGKLDNYQIAWFESELAAAPTGKALIVAMHHPIYSADQYHAGSQYMGQLLEQAIQKTGRTPDVIFAGHVHNYQRFHAHPQWQRCTLRCRRGRWVLAPPLHGEGSARQCDTNTICNTRDGCHAGKLLR